MHKIAAFVNPRSGVNLRDKWRIRKIRSILKSGDVYATKSFEDLEKAAMALPQNQPDIVAIDGGDGTISTVIGAIYKHWPQEISLPYFAFLSGGTFNALPRYAGIYKGLPYLKSITQSSFEQLFFQELDLMKIQDDRNIETFGFSFAIGLPVALLKEFYRHKRLKYIWIAFMGLRLFFSGLAKGKYYQKFNQHMPFAINQQQEEWLTVMCQSIPSFGAPLCNIFYRSNLARGQFHVLATKATLQDFGWYASAIYGGRVVPIMDIDQQMDQMNIKSEQEFCYQVNGELEYWDKPCIAKEVNISQGITIKVIKPIPKVE